MIEVCNSCLEPKHDGECITPEDAVPHIETLDQAIEFSGKVMQDAMSRYDLKGMVGLFSGGNDSTLMVHLTRPFLTHAAHINTGIGIPETTQFVKDTCKILDLELIELITPPEVYEALVLNPGSLRQRPQRDSYEPGFPGPNAHGTAYFYLKQRRIRELRRMFVAPRSGKLVGFVTGIRQSESTRRMGRGITQPIKESDKDGGIVWINPVIAFTPTLMNQYRERFNVPRNPVADLLHRSGECLCGAFAKADELKEIELWYPEVGARIRGYERKLKEMGVPRCAWGGQGKISKMPPPGPLCHSCTIGDEHVHRD